ncbi:MAG: hypothetical protein ABEJ40_08260 [Haloarculaceae archaeon]
MERRAFLATAGTALGTTVVGCLGSSDAPADGDEPDRSPTAEPTTPDGTTPTDERTPPPKASETPTRTPPAGVVVEDVPDGATWPLPPDQRERLSAPAPRFELRELDVSLSVRGHVTAERSVRVENVTTDF